jgi:hypothetical protein
MYLLLLSVMLCACSSSNDIASTQASSDTKVSISEKSNKGSKKESAEDSKADEQNMFSETNEDGIRLELVEVSGADPIYTLTFKKKDTKSGKYLKFLNSKPKKGVGLPNIDIKVEPESGYGYWVSPEDECHVNIFNIDRNDMVKIIISGIEYTFTPNKENTEEKTINKTVKIKAGEVTIRKALFYPEYVALYLGENTAKAYDNIFWALDTEGNRKTPIVYEQEEGKVLVYSKKDVMYNNALHLQGEYNEGYDNIDIELD